MTAIAMEHKLAARPTERFVVVVFDGVSLGIMSFAFGVFDMAVHYGVLPDLELRVLAGEPATAVTGGGLSCYVPYDLDAIKAASLVIVPNWRDPAEPDRKSTRLNSSHSSISYAVFCLKKKKEG